MNTSAKIRSGLTSGSRRTATSPFPTATTSIWCSASASVTIFWILLLSSATRIFGTIHPLRRRPGAQPYQLQSSIRNTAIHETSIEREQGSVPHASGSTEVLPGNELMQTLLLLAGGFGLGIRGAWLA